MRSAASLHRGNSSAVHDCRVRWQGQLSRRPSRHRAGAPALLSALGPAGCRSIGIAGAPCQLGSSEQHHHQQQQQACVCGIVIVDHGSRRAASNDMLVEFCDLYRALTRHPIVEPAHMEIAEPTIAQAVGRCVAAGATQVVVAPYFLSRGRHIQQDIPALVEAAQEQFPGIRCSVAEPIGIDPIMVRIIQSRVTDALLKDCPAAMAAPAAAANDHAAAAATPAAAMPAAAVAAPQQ